ncbi:MAG TPA: hypothetical protein VMU30_12430 [Bacteroidota bacterium]|nr:hypothetical protein [Bacteroidota bacterium]
MRTDIFIVGARLLGVWQLVGAIETLAYLIFNWMKSYPMSPTNHEYQLIRVGVELFVGLYLVLRPYHLCNIIERFTETIPMVQKEEEGSKEKTEDK